MPQHLLPGQASGLALDRGHILMWSQLWKAVFSKQATPLSPELNDLLQRDFKTPHHNMEFNSLPLGSGRYVVASVERVAEVSFSG